MTTNDAVRCPSGPGSSPFGTEAANASSPYRETIPNALADVAAERRRQIEAEGWTPEHDDKHAAGQMAGAAACYALNDISHWAAASAVLRFWPWDADWWKPRTPRENLVRAGALILAEIERLDRAQAIDAGTGETGTGSIAEGDESAVHEMDAPNPGTLHSILNEGDEK